MDPHSLIVIGAGPAGCSAAIYARRFNIQTTLLYAQPGGLIATAHLVENWPGIKSITGSELGKELMDHATHTGANLIQTQIKKIHQKDDYFVVETSDQEYLAHTVILASGTFPRQLGIPGEKEFLGKGVSYCATCDGAFFKDKVVCVIGGSDSCCNEAEMLAEYASKVYLIYRRDRLRAEPANVERIEKDPRVEILYNTELTEIKGQDKVEKVVLNTGKELEMDGVFVAIGREPLTPLLDDFQLEFSDRGELIVDEKNMTKVPGLFAAGDVTPGIKQAIIAAASGVQATFGAWDYLKKLDRDYK